MVSLKILVLIPILAVLPSAYSVGMGRIVGGIETTISKRPYQASLQLENGGTYTHQCGASILSSTYLLSAAHCLPSSGLSRLYARVGSTTYNSGGQLVKIATFQRNPSYNAAFLDYDFAILTVEAGQEIVFGPNVQPVTLTENTNPDDDTMVTVSGWGVTDESSSIAPLNLREVDLPVFNHNRCRSVYLFITSRQICLGGTPQGGTSACFGDSGGPAVQDGVQYALVSGGNSCSAPNVPGIYARISSVRPWIRELTGI